MKCRICGCTDEHSCPGGCYWVEDDLCSRCDEAIEAVARWKHHRWKHQVDVGAGGRGDPHELEDQVDVGSGGREDSPELEHQVDVGDVVSFDIAGKLHLSIGMFNGRFCGSFNLQTLRGGIRPLIDGTSPFWTVILTADELTQLKEAIGGALFHAHCAQLKEQYHDARRKHREEDER
jgi:hypothetical protein